MKNITKTIDCWKCKRLYMGPALFCPVCNAKRVQSVPNTNSQCPSPYDERVPHALLSVETLNRLYSTYNKGDFSAFCNWVRNMNQQSPISSSAHTEAPVSLLPADGKRPGIILTPAEGSHASMTIDTWSEMNSPYIKDVVLAVITNPRRTGRAKEKHERSCSCQTCEEARHFNDNARMYYAECDNANCGGWPFHEDQRRKREQRQEKEAKEAERKDEGYESENSLSRHLYKVKRFELSRKAALAMSTGLTVKQISTCFSNDSGPTKR